MGTESPVRRGRDTPAPDALEGLAAAVERRYGLSLRACTPEGLEQRLKYRLHDRAFHRIEDYAEHLLYAEDAAAWDGLLETLTTNDSRLFGLPADFLPLFEIETQARWARRLSPGGRPFRCLSAGSGAGEEAYSLAMALEEVRSRHPSLEYEVVGADLSARALAIARAAVYPAAHAAALPPEWRERYFEPAGSAVRVAVVRARVHFARANLVEADALAPLGGFDVVFARDVLSVLSPGGRAAALRNLVAALEPGGVLLLSPGESIGEIGTEVVPIRWGERYAYRRDGGDRGESPSEEEREPEPDTALVAHRSTLVRTWLRLLLERRGYRVQEAPDGMRALEIAVSGRARERYFLEWTLPRRGGAFVADELNRLYGLSGDSIAYLAPGAEGAESPPFEASPGRRIALPLGEEALEPLLGPIPT